jgi:hypothetical protein
MRRRVFVKATVVATKLASHQLTLRHASIRTFFELTLRGSVHDEVRPLGRRCHLLIGLPIGWTKAGVAVTGPEAIGQALQSSLLGSLAIEPSSLLSVVRRASLSASF